MDELPALDLPEALDPLPRLDELPDLEAPPQGPGFRLEVGDDSGPALVPDLPAPEPPTASQDSGPALDGGYSQESTGSDSFLPDLAPPHEDVPGKAPGMPQDAFGVTGGTTPFPPMPDAAEGLPEAATADPARPAFRGREGEVFEGAGVYAPGRTDSDRLDGIHDGIQALLRQLSRPTPSGPAREVVRHEVPHSFGG